MNRNTEAGGVIIYVQDNLKTKIIKKNKNCETLWLKVKGKESEIVIGAVYSPCENITTKKAITEFVNELQKDLKEIKENITENIILVGDFNAHMGNDREGIQGNHPTIGKNGSVYRQMIKENDLTLINNTKNCTGKWTRIQGDKKSILDLTITTKELAERTNLKIDENQFTIESSRAETDHKM